MAGISSFHRNRILNYIRGTNFAAAPANWYISMHSNDPGISGASELSGSGYARQAIAGSTGAWNAPVNQGSFRIVDNITALTFGPATAAWAPVQFVGIYDASTGGNFIYGGGTTAQTLNSGDNYTLAAGALDVKLTGFSTYFMDQVLKHLRGTTPTAPVANWYVSLHSANPGVTGASELTGSGYARKAIAGTTGGWAAPADDSGDAHITNSTAVTFGPASAAWLTATYAGLWDASTAGNFIWFGPTTNATLQTNDTYKLDVGQIDLRVR